MKKIIYAVVLGMVCLLSGCFGNTGVQATLYDLGPVETIPLSPIIPSQMPTIYIAKVASSEWLNSRKIYYRLGHINALQTRAYSESLWNGQPTKLVRDRLQSRLIASRENVRKPDEILKLALYIEDFSQYFFNDQQSEARVSIRATLYNDEGFFAQKIFTQKEAALTADAAGGIKALSIACDDVMSEIILWMIQAYQK